MGLMKTTEHPLLKETTIVTLLTPEIHDMNFPEEEEGSFYILIPLGVLLAIIVLSLAVYLMARNRRRLAHIYCKKRQRGQNFTYNDDNYDSPLEQDPCVVEEEEDEVDNDDNPTKSLLSGKLQINNRYENYLSTSHLNKSSELFT